MTGCQRFGFLLRGRRTAVSLVVQVDIKADRDGSEKAAGNQQSITFHGTPYAPRSAAPEANRALKRCNPQPGRSPIDAYFCTLVLSGGGGFFQCEDMRKLFRGSVVSVSLLVTAVFPAEGASIPLPP